MYVGMHVLRNTLVRFADVSMCSTDGRGYAEEATFAFRSPAYDGGLPILAYKFETSIDGGGTWVDHGEVPLASLSPDGWCIVCVCARVYVRAFESA